MGRAKASEQSTTAAAVIMAALVEKKKMVLTDIALAASGRPLASVYSVLREAKNCGIVDREEDGSYCLVDEERATKIATGESSFSEMLREGPPKKAPKKSAAKPEPEPVVEAPKKPHGRQPKAAKPVPLAKAAKAILASDAKHPSESRDVAAIIDQAMRRASTRLAIEGALSHLTVTERIMMLADLLASYQKTT